MALCFVGTLNLINPDALIVRHNLEHYRETGDLDMAYLTSLSAGAVPLLVAAWTEVENDEQLVDPPYCCGDECATTMAEMLGDNLRIRYETMLDNRHWFSWPAYHQAKYRANHALACFYTPQATAVRLGNLKRDCGS